MLIKTNKEQEDFSRNTLSFRKINFLILFLFMVFFLSACGVLDFMDEEMNKAVEKKNPKLCLKMKEDVSRKERCLTAVAEAKEDAGVCDLIETENEKDKCFSGVAIKKEDVEICERISQDSKKGACYRSLAINTQNESICEKVPSERTQGECYKEIAVKKNDDSICAKITDDFSGARCYVDIAKNKKDVSICDKIDSRESHVSDCIEGVAKEMQDESICGQIEKARYSDGCFASLASIKKDSSICSKIQVERSRNACYKNLGASSDEQAEEANDEEEEEEEEEEYGVIEKDGKLYIKSKSGEVLKITSSDLPNWASAQMVVVGATAVCVGPPSTISTGDSNVLLNGLPVARKGDTTSHGGSIVVGSDKIFVNGVPAAFVGANTVCPMVDPGPVPHVGGPISNNGY